jgi:hypothetical protein
LILHARCLRALIDVLKDYIERDKLNEFLDKLLEVSGTNSSFKIVLKEVKIQLERTSETD